jgi:hypothetical protein
MAGGKLKIWTKCINRHCNDFNGTTVLITVDLVSSRDKSFEYLRLGRKNILANRLWSLMTSYGQLTFTTSAEILH